MHSKRTLGRPRNSQDYFFFTAKDGVSIVTTKGAAYMSSGLSRLLVDEGKVSASLKNVDARLLLLAVQWLEYTSKLFHLMRTQQFDK